MGLLDLFKKKKTEEIPTVTKRELTSEYDDLFEFIKNNYPLAYDSIKDNKEGFLNSDKYDFFNEKYMEEINNTYENSKNIDEYIPNLVKAYFIASNNPFHKQSVSYQVFQSLYSCLRRLSDVDRTQTS